MEENTSIRLQRIMKERGLKQADVLALAQPYCKKYGIKLGKSDLSQFVSGKVTPGQWKLTILGMALDVSEPWLMGLDVPMERVHIKKGPTPEAEDGNTQKFVELFEQLDDGAQKYVISSIKGILSEQE